MKQKLSERVVYARWLTDRCVRNNTNIEDIHSGKALPKKYMVGYSRITDQEMRQLMLLVEKNMASAIDDILHLNNGGSLSIDGKNFFDKKKTLKMLKKAFFGGNGISWDNPKLNDKTRDDQ